MAQEVIKQTWDELVTIVEFVILPPLYGTIDPSRKLLNKRQLSVLKSVLSILMEFFHADGEELGLDLNILKSKAYRMVQEAIRVYFDPLNRLMREYELSFKEGKDKEWLLRLVRMYIEKSKDEKYMEWMENQLNLRKEAGRR